MSGWLVAVVIVVCVFLVCLTWLVGKAIERGR